MTPDDVLVDGLELGYVQLWRKIKNSAILRDPHLLQLWVWILVKAAWGPRTVSIVTGKGRTLVHLQPGQFVFGRKSASDEIGQPAETVRDRMTRLKSLRMIATQPATHYSVVTVVNWASYQGKAGKSATQPAGQSATQPPPNRHKEEVESLNKDQKTFPDASASGPLSDRGNGKPPLKMRGRMPKKEYPRAVLDVYQAYCENIITVPAKKADALRNIAARIKEGYTPEQLIGAVERYYEERQGNPDALPYHANNFFGQKAYFLGYLPDPGAGSTEAAHV
jgi:hypothetical protein